MSKNEKCEVGLYLRIQPSLKKQIKAVAKKINWYDSEVIREAIAIGLRKLITRQK